MIATFALLSLSILVLAVAYTLSKNSQAPPPELYDRYGQPVPLGHSRYFHVEYKPYEDLKNTVVALLFGFVILFAIVAYASNVWEADPTPTEEGTLYNEGTPEIKEDYAQLSGPPSPQS